MPPGSGQTSGAAAQLRQRASVLRTTASKISSSAALDLYRRAGDDVWRGPTPTRCLDELLQMRTDLQRAADDLRDAATQLDQRAEQLEALVRAQAATLAGPGAVSG
jgi:hypothetical protein